MKGWAVWLVSGLLAGFGLGVMTVIGVLNILGVHTP